MGASLHFFSPEVCLASELIHELSQWTQAELAQTLLIVPTQRLGTAILSGILQHHAAIRTPAIVTFEKLLSQQAQHLNLSLIPDSAVELLLHQLLSSGIFTQLQLGHERELRLLHNELFEHGLRESAVDELQRIMSEDIYKSETHLGSLFVRSQEIKAILQQLDASLQEQGMLTRSALLAACAKDLSDHWSAESLQPYKRIVFAAYTSVAKSWRSVLECLLGDERCSFWLHEAPELYHNSSPLKELVAWIRSLHDDAPTLKAYQSRPKPQIPKAFIASSPMEEARWAISLSRQWIEEGLSPHQIAILVSRESTYGAALRSYAADLGDCNIALAQSFSSLLPGRFLSLIHILWHGEEECSQLLGLLHHPSIEAWLHDKGSPILDRLRESLLHSGIPRDYQLLCQEIPEELRLVLSGLLQRLEIFRPNREAKVSVWQEELETLAKDFDIFACAEEADLLQSAQDLFAGFLESLRIIDTVSTQLMTGYFFWEILSRHLLSGDVRGTGEPLAGLQILSIPEARSMPFSRVILIGCQEGFFPQALPQDVLLDNYLKKAMGLPGWEVLESMEDQTFHLLLARLPQMLLFRSKRRGDEAVVRSRFTEALMVQYQLEEQSLPLWAEVFEKSSPLLEAFPDEPEGYYQGDLEQLWAKMSASRLEKLIRCPYAFLLSQLQVHELRPPPWDGDARREGVWLHAVLEAFFSGKYQGKKILPEWVIPQQNFAESALARLMSLTDRLAPVELKDSPIKRHLEQHSWPQFIAHLQILGIDKPGKMKAVKRELSFGPHTPHEVSVQVGERWRMLIGRIDALDQFDDLTLITDYKRRNTPSISASERGSAPQLGIYALALACFDPELSSKPLLLGYWNIYEGEWKSHGINAAAKELPMARALSSRQTPDIEALKAGILTQWQWREDEIRRTSHFHADPSSCELCSYDGICRKEDPRSRTRIQTQNTWAQRIKSHSDRGGSQDAAE